MLPDSLKRYAYNWPASSLETVPGWQALEEYPLVARAMPETREELAQDSRWPAFFPVPLSIITTSDGTQTALEKEVGASIVNRFPYVIALSFCREHLSQRHHTRHNFTEILERGGSAAVQFLPPGPAVDAAMAAIASTTDQDASSRIAQSGLSVRRAITNDAPVFDAAYMVYEARLVQPSKDFGGETVYETAWKDVGSHRVYFLEINAIQLREDIADGRSQIAWRSLPAWSPQMEVPAATPVNGGDGGNRYRKGYSPQYRFPSSSTTAFESDYRRNGMAVKLLPPLPDDQVEVDNDRARWPCFFPSAAGMITSWAEPGVPNLMPCGSTTIVSRHPLTFAIAVSYAPINQRYAPRASLNIIRKTGRFGCGVPFINDAVLDAIRYAGNTSLSMDANKVANSGLSIYPLEWAPVLAALPLHFDCQVIDEVRLGTHILFLGEVRRIIARKDLTPQNPLQWCAWPGLVVPETGRTIAPEPEQGTLAAARVLPSRGASLLGRTDHGVDL
jgi:flavin reductase (DIM6/NTAB) family NADH-FMN oxidoreductase RutF